MPNPPVAIRVSGEAACFTRPETKTERVSYPVLTPSAARGILEAVFWKPQFTWQIQQIWVLNPIAYWSMVRNEVTSKVSVRAARGWQRSGYGGYDAATDRTQRHTLALRDVDYLVRAQVRVNPGVDAPAAKYRDQFQRRLARGQCFQQPYLGCREYAAEFCPPDGTERPVPVNDKLGRMLLDIDYTGDPTGRGIPLFFPAELKGGVLHVPARPLAEAS